MQTVQYPERIVDTLVVSTKENYMSITRREYFAGLAMQTILDHQIRNSGVSSVHSTTLENISVKAWEIANVLDNPKRPEKSE